RHLAAARLSGWRDRISRLVIRRLADLPPKMACENIPVNQEAKLQGALAPLAPAAGIEYPLTGLAGQQGRVEPGYVAQGRLGRHGHRGGHSAESNERCPKASHNKLLCRRAEAVQAPATAEIRVAPWLRCRLVRMPSSS